MNKNYCKRVLVLCTGNSCRSQMAHGFLESFDRNLIVCSAGTEPVQSVNPLAVQVMSETGIDIGDHIPTNVSDYLNDEWDYVITVCGNANETCPVFTGRVKERLHIGFDDPSTFEGDYESKVNEFRRVRDEIKDKMYQFYISKVK